MRQIKNFDKLSKRILKAISAKERIILYGDSDLDGTVAVIVLKEAIVNLGGSDPTLYFSDRHQEEAGLNELALNSLNSYAPALLVVVDCGIGNFNEVKLAGKMGFDVVIADHHEILERLPEASIIVNPKQGRKNGRFYHLAAAGIAFELAEAILGKKFSGKLKEDLLGLTALATISDMVPEIGENKKIISEGLIALENSWRPAINVLFDFGIAKNCFSTREIVRKAIVIINITDKEGDLGEIYLLLVSPTIEEAKMRFERFLQKGSDRQIKIEESVEKFKAKIFSKGAKSIIFEGDEDVPRPLLGVIASRICLYFEKPIFIYKKTEKENVGSFRTPSGFDGIRALVSCSKLLRKYGGHAPAGGFNFQEKDKESLEKGLLDYFTKEAKKKK